MWIEETQKVPITGCALQQKKKQGLFRFQKGRKLCQRAAEEYWFVCPHVPAAHKDGIWVSHTRMLGPRIVDWA